MKILYGTENRAKYEAMKRVFESFNHELICLGDLNVDIPSVAEVGKTPLENARIKAHVYYQAFKMPVFSCDSALHLEGVPDELQPGVHVRRVNGKRLNDEEMIDYYASIAKERGDYQAYYYNAICFIKNDLEIYESMDPSLCCSPFLITSIPHQVRNEGFPIDSISIEISSGKYFYDLEKGSVDEAINEGFRGFFMSCLEANE